MHNNYYFNNVKIKRNIVFRNIMRSVVHYVSQIYISFQKRLRIINIKLLKQIANQDSLRLNKYVQLLNYHCSYHCLSLLLLPINILNIEQMIRFLILYSIKQFRICFNLKLVLEAIFNCIFIFKGKQRFQGPGTNISVHKTLMSN